MKFIFGYKTRDNEIREGVISAPSRDAVYQLLKKEGIRPFRVELAPGIWNRFLSLGKRTYAIVVLVVILISCAAIICLQFRTLEQFEQSSVSSLPRHQIYGDPALMEELERTDYKGVFAHDGERLLARYAQPGHLPITESGKTLPQVSAHKLAHTLSPCLTNEIVFLDSDSREITELKRIVLSMKAELRRYLANGIGTPERYVRRLNERQIRESQIYYTAKNKLEKETDPAEWEKVNATLRAIGLRTIPQPSLDQ